MKYRPSHFLFLDILVASFLIFTFAPQSAHAYSYLGYKWSNPGADFWLDIAGWDPALIQQPASTWNNAGSPFRFRLKGNNVYRSGDGLNTIARYTLNNDLVAQTVSRYNGSNYLLESDTIFNMKYGWGCCGESNLYDVRNVMTHEFGHWLMLGDLYSWTYDRNKTMYYSTSPGETKKQSLEQDDINGINYIY